MISTHLFVCDLQVWGNNACRVFTFSIQKDDAISKIGNPVLSAGNISRVTTTQKISPQSIR